MLTGGGKMGGNQKGVETLSGAVVSSLLYGIIAPVSIFEQKREKGRGGKIKGLGGKKKRK